MEQNKKHTFITLLLLLLMSLPALSQQVINLNSANNGRTIDSCYVILYDSGGAGGSYSNNEDYRITICGGHPMEVTINEFNIEHTSSEYMRIYNGATTLDPQLATIAGTSTGVVGTQYASSDDCITISWHSDGTGTAAGFKLTIRCLMNCQDYSINIVSSDPEPTDTNSTYILGCPNVGVQLTAGGTYPHAGENYEQNDNNLTWTWTITGGDNSATITGDNVLTPDEFDFSTPGAYTITLAAADIMHCPAYMTGSKEVWISVPPTFAGTSIAPTIVCPGEEVQLTPAVQTYEWTYEFPQLVEDTFCFADSIGVPQSADFRYTTFEPGAILDDVNQILSICLMFEHSWIGDLDIWVECPDHRRVTFMTYTGFPGVCGGAYFGEARDFDDVDCDNPETMGRMYEYCWSPNATRRIADNCAGYSHIMESFDHNTMVYAAENNSFNNLVGCPLNGTWRFAIIDNQGLDDGSAAHFELNFSDDIVEQAMADVISFENVYDISAGSTTAWWTGINMNNDHGGPATANPAAPGEQRYVFHATDDFGCTYDTTVSVTVRGFDDPVCCLPFTTNAGTDDMTCSNTYIMSATLGTNNTGEWSQIDGPGTATWANSNAPNSRVTVDNFGVYTFRWTEMFYGNASCAETDDVQISFWPQPEPTFTYTPIMCYGESTTITYGGNMTETATYTWDFDGGIPAGSGTGQGPHQIRWDNAGNHSVSLTVSEHGCTSDNMTATINTPPELTHSLTLFDDPCFQSCRGQAEATVSGGTLPYSFSWASVTNILPNLCAGTYVVTITDANNCETSETFVINEPPLLQIVRDSIVALTCHNSHNGEIHITATGGTGTLHFAWSDIGEADSVRVNLQAGTYTITITDAHGCNVVKDYIVGQPEELIALISPDISICEGDNTTVMVQGMGGTLPYSFYWDSGQGEYLGPPSQNVVPDTTTTHHVYIQDANLCRSNTAMMTITVSPEMVIDSLVIQHNTCYQSCDGSVELRMHGGLPPLTYSWGSDDHHYDGLCAGIYTVTVTDIIGCNVNTSYVIEEPNEMIFSSNVMATNCHGSDDGQATIYVQGGTPPYSYLWPAGETTATLRSTAGKYTVTVTDVNGCRIVSSFVIPEPTAIVLAPVDDRTICQGSSTTLVTQASGGSPYYDFRWHWADTDSTTRVHNSNTLTASPTHTTTYTVEAIDSHGCISSPLNVTVRVHPDLKINSVLTSNDTVCPGAPARIFVDVEGGNGGPYIISYCRDGQNEDVVVAPPFTVYPDTTQKYWLTLKDMCGTPPVHDTIKIIVYPKPGSNFRASLKEGCAPLNVTFEVTDSLSTNVEYLWDFGDHGYSEEKNPTHTYVKAGTYDVTLHATNDHNCKHDLTREGMVSVYQPPTASFEPSSESVNYLSSEIEFINHTVGADEYFWSFGDGDSSANANPRHVFRDIGEFEIQLVAAANVTDQLTCRDTTTRTIYVGNEFAFYMPTSFTPNGDGINDCARPCGNGIDRNNFTFEVYDRWGNKVFETDIFNPLAALENCDACSEGAWDGTFKRKNSDTMLENGVYSWFCEFYDMNGTLFQKQGKITLIR